MAKLKTVTVFAAPRSRDIETWPEVKAARREGWFIQDVCEMDGGDVAILLTDERPDAKTLVKIITLKHPLSPRNIEDFGDIREMLEAQGYVLKGSRRECDVERVELHKTLDYNREERRAAKRSGQVLQHNQYKSIIPDGYVPIMPDDPRLQDPPPAEGDTP